MMFSRPDLDAPLADHFGKAKWLMIVEPPSACELVRNTGLDGRSIATGERGVTS